MKRILNSIIIIIAFMLFFSISTPTQAQKKNVKESEGAKAAKSLPFEPLKIQVPEVGKDVERIVTKNGIILFLKEDHSIPIINILSITRTGAEYDRKDRYGVARLTGALIGLGGTKDFTPDEFDRERDYLAANWNTYIDAEKGGVFFELPSSQLDRGLNLFTQMLRYPTFDNKRLEVEKGNIREEVLRENDDPGTVASKTFKRKLFPDYFEGWKYNLKTVKGITRDDLKARYDNFFRPNNTMIAISGDFNREELLKKLEAKLGDWEKGTVDFSGYQKYEKKFKPGVYYVDMKVDQSSIRIGHLGVSRDNPDRYALEVFNRIFGGGFNSILNEKIRSNEGLAYYVGGGFRLDMKQYGTFTMGCATKPESTIKASRMMIDIMKQMRDEKVSEERLNLAKDYLINSFLYKFEDPIEVNRELLTLEYEKMPADYYKNYRENISKVTAEDVQRVAEKYLQPEQLTIVIVGNVKKFDKPLSELGNVEEIKLEDAGKQEEEKK